MMIYWNLSRQLNITNTTISVLWTIHAIENELFSFHNSNRALDFQLIVILWERDDILKLYYLICFYHANQLTIFLYATTFHQGLKCEIWDSNLCARKESCFWLDCGFTSGSSVVHGRPCAIGIRCFSSSIIICCIFLTNSSSFDLPLCCQLTKTLPHINWDQAKAEVSNKPISQDKYYGEAFCNFPTFDSLTIICCSSIAGWMQGVRWVLVFDAWRIEDTLCYVHDARYFHKTQLNGCQNYTTVMIRSKSTKRECH